MSGRCVTGSDDERMKTRNRLAKDEEAREYVYMYNSCVTYVNGMKAKAREQQKEQQQGK